jgi:hypothetical protein
MVKPPEIRIWQSMGEVEQRRWTRKSTAQRLLEIRIPAEEVGLAHFAKRRSIFEGVLVKGVVNQ